MDPFTLLFLPIMALVLWFAMWVVGKIWPGPPAPPPPSDCPHCTWYNPAQWTKQRYIARIDHMITYHGVAVRQDELDDIERG